MAADWIVIIRWQCVHAAHLTTFNANHGVFN